MGAEEHLARGEPGDPAALTGRLFRDMTGALELLTVYLGERLGLYQALYADGPATSAELAARTGTTERYIREWLEHHAASGRSHDATRHAAPVRRGSGFRDLEVLPVKAGMLRFYRLTP